MILSILFCLFVYPSFIISLLCHCHVDVFETSVQHFLAGNFQTLCKQVHWNKKSLLSMPHLYVSSWNVLFSIWLVLQQTFFKHFSNITHWSKTHSSQMIFPFAAAQEILMSKSCGSLTTRTLQSELVFCGLRNSPVGLEKGAQRGSK